uniref:Uncharacterized protein n=1 Tax=Aegilops tauschii subsp. strangulata TaxID=200361 RepID=A0A453DE93_AEGTS
MSVTGAHYVTYFMPEVLIYLQTGENMDLFLRTNSNIKTILSRMSETPGIMGQMPPLQELAHEDKLNSLLQVDRMVQSYSAAHTSHMKEEPRS